MRFPRNEREHPVSTTRQSYGGHSEGETPGPIPNPEAKPFSADGTALARVWESRTPPDTIQKKPPPHGGGFFCFPGLSEGAWSRAGGVAALWSPVARRDRSGVRMRVWLVLSHRAVRSCWPLVASVWRARVEVRERTRRRRFHVHGGLARGECGHTPCFACLFAPERLGPVGDLMRPWPLTWRGDHT